MKNPIGTILHTESSTGWGGQEMRILKESLGMRKRGYTVIFAVVKGGQLVQHAKAAGFTVYEIPFSKWRVLSCLRILVSLMRRHHVDIINTHSSLDAWIAGSAARLIKRPILRTRHLSTTIRKGLNSILLYKGLADGVVTTSSCIIPMICTQAGLNPTLCRCVATGIDPQALVVTREEVESFKRDVGIYPGDFVVGTACVLRSWKGINDMLRAAASLRSFPHIKWLIVGGGNVEKYQQTVHEWGLERQVILAGHKDNPYPALQAMDIFALLSTANEGISQASLQAAYFKLPLITTTVGGLPEVCLEGKTGIVVPPFAPKQVAHAVKKLHDDVILRQRYGENAHRLVMEKYTMTTTLDEMEKMYRMITPSIAEFQEK